MENLNRIKRLVKQTDGTYTVESDSFSHSDSGNSIISQKKKNKNLGRSSLTKSDYRTGNNVQLTSKNLPKFNFKNDFLTRTFTEKIDHPITRNPPNPEKHSKDLKKIVSNELNFTRSKSLTKFEKKIIEQSKKKENYFKLSNNIANNGSHSPHESIKENEKYFSLRSKSSHSSVRSHHASYYRMRNYGMSLKQYSKNFFSTTRCSSVKAQSLAGERIKNDQKNEFERKNSNRIFLKNLKKFKRKLRLEVGVLNKIFDETEKRMMRVLRNKRKETMKIFLGFEKLISEAEKNFKLKLENLEFFTRKTKNILRKSSPVVDILKFRIYEKSEKGNKAFLKEYLNKDVITKDTIDLKSNMKILDFLREDLNEKIGKGPSLKKLKITKDDLNSKIKELEESFLLVEKFNLEEKIYRDLEADVVTKFGVV